MNRKTLAAAGAVLALAAVLAQASPMGTEFTYQGRLCDGGVPANGLYDFTFELYDAPDPPGGSLLGSQTLSAVWVTNGLFTTNINFGITPFAGEARWLKILACTAGAGAPVPLGPRQELKPTPYALYAATAGAAATATTASGAPWGGLTGIPAGFLDGVDDDHIYTRGEGLNLVGGMFSVDTNFFNGRYWALAGNGGTTAGTHFVGTTDDEPLELKVYSQRALRLEPTKGAPNFIAGNSNNSVAVGCVGAAIGGGATNVVSSPWASSFGAIGGGAGNRVGHQYGTVGGGGANSAETIGATIAGGTSNRVASCEYGSDYATIGGGSGNKTYCDWATIGGGRSNWCASTFAYGTIGGGFLNMNVGNYGTIGGGKGNVIQEGLVPDHPGSTIAGGESNLVNTAYGSIGGGFGNSIQTNATGSAIVGGTNNVISQDSSCAAIGGGASNHMGANADYSLIGGGRNNDIVDSWYTTIAGGYGNAMGTLTDDSFIGGGRDNYIETQAIRGVISGGYQNTVATNADYATIPGGRQAKAANYGQYAYASGQFAAPGDAQASMFVVRRTTSSATPTELLLDNSSAHITVPKTNSTWTFDILVVARTQGVGGEFLEGTSAGYQLRGIVEAEGYGTTVRGLTKTVLWEDIVAWDATVDTDANSHLRVMVTGSTYPIRWVAHVRTVEVTFP